MLICLAFDGVLHSASSGWRGPSVINDPPVEGAMEFILELIDFGANVCVYSSRSNQPMGVRAMKRWLSKHPTPYMDIEKMRGEPTHIWLGRRERAAEQLVEQCIGFPNHKPPAHVTIDDRGITFKGKWPTMKSLKSFKPWRTKAKEKKDGSTS